MYPLDPGKIYKGYILHGKYLNGFIINEPILLFIFFGRFFRIIISKLPFPLSMPCFLSSYFQDWLFHVSHHIAFHIAKIVHLSFCGLALGDLRSRQISD